MDRQQDYKFIIQGSDLSRRDILQVVAVHRREIGQGFLSSLGDQALELVFSLAVESKWGILLAARDTAGPGHLCAFALGAFDTGAFYKDFMLKKSLSAVFLLAPKLFSPARVLKILETLLYPAKRDNRTLPRAELLDIAVLQEYQGSGLAQRLFHHFSARLAKGGVREFKITTGESLVRAQHFYETLGAEKVSTIEIHKGQKTLVYIYKIPGPG